MNHAESAYGLWWLVIINSAIFIMFAFSFFKPATRFFSDHFLNFVAKSGQSAGSACIPVKLHPSDDGTANLYYQSPASRYDANCFDFIGNSR